MVDIRLIEQGRDLEDVLEKYMGFYTAAEAEARRLGKQGDEAIAAAMQGATYRLYLLGLKDGIDAAKNNKS